MRAASTIRLILAARALRGGADGFVSVLLVAYLATLGFSPLQVGAVVTGTLIGSAVLTLAVGLAGHRHPPRGVLLAASALMAATGVGLAAASTFWVVLVVAVAGTLNPNAGDVSLFLPTEQAHLASQVDASARPRTYAHYNLAGILAGALGALASGAPERVAETVGWSLLTAQRAGFLLYAVVAVAVAGLYRRLPTPPAGGEPGDRPGDRMGGVARRPLVRPRRTVVELAVLFSLDSAASGLVGRSMLVLWLHLRFDLSTGATGAVFFAAGLLGGASQLLAGPLAARIGLVRAMVVTHLPANVFLALAAFAPGPGSAVALLLLRALFAQMDVPARQSFVMAVVPPEERAAAASVTNVPRSMAAACTPLLAGALLARSSTGWPLLAAGVGKIVYDLLLLRRFRDVAAEVGAPRAPRPPRPERSRRLRG